MSERAGACKYSRCVCVQGRRVGGGAGQDSVWEGVRVRRMGVVRVRVRARGADSQHGRAAQRCRAGCYTCNQHTVTALTCKYYLRRCAARGASTSGGAAAAAGVVPSHGHVTPDTRNPVQTRTVTYASTVPIRLYLPSNRVTLSFFMHSKYDAECFSTIINIYVAVSLGNTRIHYYPFIMTPPILTNRLL